MFLNGSIKRKWANLDVFLFYPGADPDHSQNLREPGWTRSHLLIFFKKIRPVTYMNNPANKQTDKFASIIKGSTTHNTRLLKAIIGPVGHQKLT